MIRPTRLFAMIPFALLAACSSSSGDADTSGETGVPPGDSSSDTGAASSPVLEEDFQLGLNRFGGCGHIVFLNLRKSGFQEVARISAAGI